jgi:hypothetical protein
MMIITHIRGGLGNQMFQYASGRSVATELDVELKLDLSWFAGAGSPRKFMLKNFPNLTYKEATKSEVVKLRYKQTGLIYKLFHRHGPHAASYIREPYNYIYWPGIKRVAAPAYLYGYWINEKYFTNIADVIRFEFTFPPLPNEAGVLGEQIAGTPNAVAVHVRRGDRSYGLSQEQEMRSAGYYARALSMIAEHTRGSAELFIASDEPDWVREHFDVKGLPFTVIDFSLHREEPWHDLNLMSLCRHHIIADSTFSWWSAWLSNTVRAGEGIVIAPKFCPSEEHEHARMPETWICV